MSRTTWAIDTAAYICDGAYSISTWEYNSAIVLSQNENCHNAGFILMTEIQFYLSGTASCNGSPFDS